MKYLVIGCVSLAVLGIGWVYVLRHDSAIGAGADSPTATTGYSKDQTFTERLETFSQKVKDSDPDAGNDGGGVEIVKWETIVVDIEPCERAIKQARLLRQPRASSRKISVTDHRRKANAACESKGNQVRQGRNVDSRLQARS